MIDAILEIPMIPILETVPVDHGAKVVLLGGPSRFGPSISLCWPANPEIGREPPSMRKSWD